MCVYLHTQNGLYCGSSSVGRARPCQGRGREFESRFPLTEALEFFQGFFIRSPDPSHRQVLLVNLLKNEVNVGMTCRGRQG